MTALLLTLSSTSQVVLSSLKMLLQREELCMSTALLESPEVPLPSVLTSFRSMEWTFQKLSSSLENKDTLLTPMTDLEGN